MLGSIWIFHVAMLVGTPAGSLPSEPANMDALLERVQEGWRLEHLNDELREAEFLAKSEEQHALLEEAEAIRQELQARTTWLESQFETNELKLTQGKEELRERLGAMGELVGIVRSVAGDTREHLDQSLVSAEFPGRAIAMGKLAQSQKVPSLSQMRNLWVTLLQEMKESGEVSHFESHVVTTAGVEVEQTVTRIGGFNAVSDGKFYEWLPELQKLSELRRQPSSRYLKSISELQSKRGGWVTATVDPSRGSVLSLLVEGPSFSQRVAHGGIIGYLILILGGLTLVVGLVRLASLLKTRSQVSKQCTRHEALDSNPLGRVMLVYQANPTTDTETLELKLDEAILKEQGGIESFLWAIKVVSVAAPLMGLLGTVTGMIQTFQAITIYGSQDPKLMAGGISEALVTTMLGLVVAIPLVFLHSWLRAMSRRLLELLAEQSAGMVARQAEARGCE